MNFKVAISECGDSLGCYRYCHKDPGCAFSEANYLVTMGEDLNSDPSRPEIEFKLGGTLSTNGSVSFTIT